MRQLFAVFCSALFLATTMVAGLNAQDNLFRVRSNKSLKFKTNDAFRIGPGTTIELSFRPMDDFVPNVPEDYQCLAYCGDAKDVAFAILLKTDYDTGQAKIGFVTSLDDATLEDSFVGLTKIDAYNETSPMTLERGRTYHLALVITKNDRAVDVFLDGNPQGSIPCDVDPAKSINQTLTFGGNVQRNLAFPFEGELGALRIWNRALPEPSVIALQKFGRTCDPFELPMLYEYGYLLAYGDFRGNLPSRCKLVFPNSALGGTWRERYANVESNIDGNGTYLDYPVYTFLRDNRGEFQVYEDMMYVGQMVPTSSADSFRFNHVDAGWPAIDFSIKHSTRAGRPVTELVCQRLPSIPRPFAGKQSGALTLIRGSLDVDGSGFSTQRFFSKAEKDRAKMNDDMTAVFLLGNNVRYKNVIYRGYNVARMDQFDLFDNGVNREDNYLFAKPESDLFTIDSDQIRILPTDLAINNRNMGIASTQSFYVSNSMEFSQMVTSRMGAGVSGSLTVGTGSASPVSVQGTINMNVVLQSEDSNELSQMESSNQDKLISMSTYQHYDLYHKKDMARLDDGFRKAITQLHQQCQSTNDPNYRQQMINRFFDEWGTHYVFGGTFGAIKWTERTIDETTVQNINRQSYDQFVSVNEGKTGSQGSFSNSLTDTFKAMSEKTRSLGGNSAGDGPAAPGDEPAPIQLDMRCIAQLCSPQYFPANPEIYNDLRNWINVAYPVYLRTKAAEKLLASNAAPEYKQKAKHFLKTGQWQSLDPKLYQVGIESTKVELCDANSGRPLSRANQANVDSVQLQINLQSANQGTSEYKIFSDGEFSLSKSENAHFRAFAPTSDEVVSVHVDGSIRLRNGSQVDLDTVARNRPADCEFFFNRETKPVQTDSQSITSWKKSLANHGTFFQFNEETRDRHFYFSGTANENRPQEVIHLLGPFSGGGFPKCFIKVTTRYQLNCVPSTNSIWSNLNANSRSAIKTDDPRFGSMTTPKSVVVDFYKNRSTKQIAGPNSQLVGTKTSSGDGN